MKAAYLEYKRPMVMGDRMMVRTWVEAIGGSCVKVQFEIHRRVGDRLKLACDGWFEYTMVSLQTARAEPIPDWILAKYSI